MSALALPRALKTRRVSPSAVLLPLAFLLVPALSAGMLMVRAPLAGRALVGGVVLGTFFVVALNSWELALKTMVVWLVFLGLVRRALIPFFGWPEFDPLLLVGPACATILWVTARERKQRTPMAVLAFLLLGLTCAQVFNPESQFRAAVLGSLFWVTPPLWFFVGRALDREALHRIMKLVTVLLIPVTLHGLYHSFGRFFPFEYTWVGVSGFGPAIFVGPGFQIRPFSSLTSPQEYAFFLAFGLMALWAQLLYERGGRVWRIPLFCAAGAAFFLAGHRTVISMFAIGFVVTAALRARLAGSRVLALGAVATLVVLAGMHASRPGQTLEAAPVGGSRISSLAHHTIAGLTNPQASTLPEHQRRITQALQSGWDHPFGRGLGQQTLGLQKQTGKLISGVDNDVATAFEILGFPAGVLFVTFMIAAFGQAFRKHIREPSSVSLFSVGILVSFLTGWYVGQMYSASMLLWLVLGSLSRPPEDAQSEPSHALTVPQRVR